MKSRNDIHRQSFQFIMLFGVVSMFGDVTYEGGRSIIGPYMALLGASATTVGLLGGLGEFIGYAFRLISGYLADRTRAYWAITFLGYGLLVSVPLLAYTNNWHVAVLFVLLERFGKAVRSPAKDTMLSHATANLGRGFGFALHEAMDQVGAIAGPLIFSAVFFLRGGYKTGFQFLWIPAALTIVFLAVARLKVPNPEALESKPNPHAGNGDNNNLPVIFWWYIAFAFISVSGFVNFQLVAYHFKVRPVMTDAQIPLFYSIAMGVDAIVALIVGKLYDRKGLSVLLLLPLLTIPVPYFAFGQSITHAFVAVILWGSAMAIHETIMRAAIADMIPTARRGFAYGIFNTVYGFAWLLGGWAMGYLYAININYIILLTVATQVVAIILFFWFRNGTRKIVHA